MLAENIKTILKEKGWTLTKLARLSGVSRSTLFDWSNSQQAINLIQLKKVAETLNVSVYNLCYGTPDPFEVPTNEILKELFSGDIRVTLHRIERKPK